MRAAFFREGDVFLPGVASVATTDDGAEETKRDHFEWRDANRQGGDGRISVSGKAIHCNAQDFVGNLYSRPVLSVLTRFDSVSFRKRFSYFGKIRLPDCGNLLGIRN